MSTETAATTTNDDFDLGPNEKKASQQKPKATYDIFFRYKPQDKPFRIRIASKPKNFRSHWKTFQPLGIKAPVKSPAYTYDEKSLDIAWAEGDWMPQERHACLVFDRDDENKLKVFEAGKSLFEIFGNWYKATKISPASNDGTDWFIWVKKDGNNTNYSATPDVRSSPFTEEEKKILDNPPIDLSKVIKIKTPEQIKEMWMQLPDDKKYNPNSKYKAGQTFNKNEFEKKYGKIVKTEEGNQNSSAQNIQVISSAKTQDNPATYNPPVQEPPEENDVVEKPDDELPF